MHRRSAEAPVTVSSHKPPTTRRWAWSDPQMRALVYQVAAIVGVVFLLAFFFMTARANLERQHIASGFGFMQHTAEFGVIQTLIPYSEEASYGRVFLVGLFNTLLVAAVGTVIAVVLGFIIGVESGRASCRERVCQSVEISVVAVSLVSELI